MKTGIVTLGCDKNTVDSEYIAGALKRRGMTAVPAPHNPLETAPPEPDLGAVIINTCGFIGPAKEQSIGAILDWAEWRRRSGRVFPLAVVGCLTQRYAAELAADIPEIDVIAGVGQFEDVARMIDEARRGGAAPAGPRTAHRESDKSDHPFFISVRDTPTVKVEQALERVPLERRDVPYGFIKIADGCNYKCAFCAIPRMKGKYRSVPRHVILHEAKDLLESGARELCIVAQDTPKYGHELYRQYRLEDLIHDICALPGDFRVRLFYLYPTGLTPRLIDLWKTEPKLCRYVDIPLQHLDAEMLRLMRRPARIDEHLEWLNRLRAEVPGFAIRTTFIVGHPGETERHFENLLRRMKEMRFERVGVFEYSEEEDVHAAGLPDHVPARVKRRRREAAMRLQAKISAELNRARIGGIERVLVESREPASGLYTGRSEKEAPDVDGLVLFRSERAGLVGQFADVRIERADVYDVFGAEVAPAAAEPARPAELAGV